MGALILMWTSFITVAHQILKNLVPSGLSMLWVIGIVLLILINSYRSDELSAYECLNINDNISTADFINKIYILITFSQRATLNHKELKSLVSFIENYGKFCINPRSS